MTHSLSNMVVATFAAMVAIAGAPAVPLAREGDKVVSLSYLDGKPANVGIASVNQVLRQIGVRISEVTIPPEARPILEASKSRAVSPDESTRLGALFAMHRGQLLDEVGKAGRRPEAHRGGYLSTSEIGDTPYPKNFDMKAIPPSVLHSVQAKYAKLHVNTSDDGVAIDEVMTVVSGGPWTWFFRLNDGEVVKLSVGPVEAVGPALRLSYSGLVPHAAFLNAPYGLTVAYAHGPKHFVMRYDDPGIEGAELLGTNPWVDFSGGQPKLKMQ